MYILQRNIINLQEFLLEINILYAFFGGGGKKKFHNDSRFILFHCELHVVYFMT